MLQHSTERMEIQPMPGLPMDVGRYMPQLSVAVPHDATGLYQQMVGYLLFELQEHAYDNPIRMYLFNSLCVNGFSNQPFGKMVEEAMNLAYVNLNQARQSAGIPEIALHITRQAAIELLTIVPELQQFLTPQQRQELNMSNQPQYAQPQGVHGQYLQQPPVLQQQYANPPQQQPYPPGGYRQPPQPMYQQPVYPQPQPMYQQPRSVAIDPGVFAGPPKTQNTASGGAYKPGGMHNIPTPNVPAAEPTPAPVTQPQGSGYVGIDPKHIVKLTMPEIGTVDAVRAIDNPMAITALPLFYNRATGIKYHVLSSTLKPYEIIKPVPEAEMNYAEHDLTNVNIGKQDNLPVRWDRILPDDSVINYPNSIRCHTLANPVIATTLDEARFIAHHRLMRTKGEEASKQGAMQYPVEVYSVFDLPAGQEMDSLIDRDGDPVNGTIEWLKLTAIRGRINRVIQNNLTGIINGILAQCELTIENPVLDLKEAFGIIREEHDFSVLDAVAEALAGHSDNLDIVLDSERALEYISGKDLLADESDDVEGTDEHMGNFNVCVLKRNYSVLQLPWSYDMIGNHVMDSICKVCKSETPDVYAHLRNAMDLAGDSRLVVDTLDGFRVYAEPGMLDPNIIVLVPATEWN